MQFVTHLARSRYYFYSLDLKSVTIFTTTLKMRIFYACLQRLTQHTNGHCQQPYNRLQSAGLYLTRQDVVYLVLISVVTFRSSTFPSASGFTSERTQSTSITKTSHKGILS